MFIVIGAAGLAVVVFVCFYISTEVIISKAQAQLVSKQFSVSKPNNDTRLVVGGGIGLIGAILLTNGTSYMSTAIPILSVMGAGVAEATYRVLNKGKEERRRQECLLLFSAVEIFTQAGYSIPQALANAREFTPILAADINKTLAAWPHGDVQALELFKDLINLPEGNQLVSLLIQINQAGTRNLANIIQAEAKQMEEKRQALAKARIAQKPLFLLIYRLLPIVVLVGMFGGMLVTRIFNEMNQFLGG